MREHRHRIEQSAMVTPARSVLGKHALEGGAVEIIGLGQPAVMP
jgi:hypothetical protein